jgi:hypothetical protein
MSYHWQGFAAEMVRHCVEALPASQAEFERHMLQWCAENWGNEPALSQVRDWVGPAFKAIQPADNDAQQLSANPD